MLLRFKAILLISLFVAGCSREDAPLVDVDPISSDDEEINAAMDHARDTFADFVATSQDTETEGTGFLAKVQIGEGDVFEDLQWNRERSAHEASKG